MTGFEEIQCVQAPPPEDLETYGALEYYDKAFDRVTPKTEKPLRKTRRVFRNVTTSDDPIIRSASLPLFLHKLSKAAACSQTLSLCILLPQLEHLPSGHP